MLVLRIDLLSGRYAATAYNDRDEVEWPPHPARLFSALVATWAEGPRGTANGDAELAALRWLEEQPAPAILASSIARAGMRKATVVFVPVNDVGVVKVPDHTKLEAAEQAAAEIGEPAARAKAAKQVAKLRDKLVADTAKETAVPAKFGKHDTTAAEHALIERRIRQPRTFPCAFPEQPAFAFEWADALPSPEIVQALSRLAQRLVRLGHSSSMVHGRVMTGAAGGDFIRKVTRFVPDDRDGELMLRWVNPGQVERLIRAHAQHQQVEPRVLPALFMRYREGEGIRPARAPAGAFDSELIVFARESGPRLPITSVAGLSRQLRRALMSVADEPIAEILSGHRPAGAPSEDTHLAIVPLPAVTGPYPDGALLGIALVLPRDTSPEARRAVMKAVGRLEKPRVSTDDLVVALELDDVAPLVLKRIIWGEDSRTTLRPRTWTRESKHWASATPIALDRNPGNLHDADPRTRASAFETARTLIVAAVQRLGLPPPSEVDVVRSCVLPGTAKPRGYPRFPSAAHKQQRVLVHARIGFAEAVRGPLLLGAGRYQGMGLCLPLDRGPSEST
jgi:CRISPR-associated protein Csb2